VDSPVRPDLTRRQFLRASATAGAALVLGASWSAGETRAATGPMSSVTAWIRVPARGAVTLMMSQSEMGQGTSTTLAAVLAHELYLSLDAVHLEFADFGPEYRDPVYNWMFTGNSFLL
jgi:isoquinoline 1-oxidoreductase subunit beta